MEACHESSSMDRCGYRRRHIGLYRICNRELWYVIESDGIEKAARKTFGWGTRQRAAGTGGQVIGKLKEGLGRVSGDGDLAAVGLADQIGGAAKGAVGSVAQAAAEMMHDLKR